MPRKHTRFETCERHRWLDGETRYRRAEFFCEGGPSDETNGPCGGGRCRIWPGLDLFDASVCDSEAAWPSEWAVNAARAEGGAK